MKILTLLFMLICLPFVAGYYGAVCWFGHLADRFDDIDRAREMKRVRKRDAAPLIKLGPGGDFTRTTLFKE